MAKTQGDKIDELSRMTTTREEPAKNMRRELDIIRTQDGEEAKALNAVKEKVAVLSERLDELKRVVERTGNRWWALLPALVGVLVGGALQFLIQLAIKKLIP